MKRLKKKVENMAPIVKKAASATILSLLGSSFILGIAVLLMKDTLVRVNTTITNVNKHNEQMVALDGSIVLLNSKIDRLDKAVSKTSTAINSYSASHSKNMSSMTVNIVRVTEKLSSMNKRHNDVEDDIKECRKNIQKIMVP